jgi:hypothetical protein
MTRTQLTGMHRVAEASLSKSFTPQSSERIAQVIAFSGSRKVVRLLKGELLFAYLNRYNSDTLNS